MESRLGELTIFGFELNLFHCFTDLGKGPSQLLTPAKDKLGFKGPSGVNDSLEVGKDLRRILLALARLGALGRGHLGLREAATRVHILRVEIVCLVEELKKY